MMSTIFVLLGPAVFVGGGLLQSPELEPDTISRGQVETIMLNYYGLRQQMDHSLSTGVRGFISRLEMDEPSQTCLADRGESCFGGDPSFWMCPPNVPCGNSARPEMLIDPLVRAANDHPSSATANGQAIYALVKYGRYDEALDLARSCSAEAPWCLLLEGYAMQEFGDVAAAEAIFRRAIRELPSRKRCEHTDATWLLGSWLQRSGTSGSAERREAEAVGCEERTAASERVWWLARPLYTVSGNDRWAEHVSRIVQWRLEQDLFELRERGGPIHGLLQGGVAGWWRSFIVRRGLRDSYFIPRSYGGSGEGRTLFLTSNRAARYHFVPDFEDGDLNRPVWRLHAELDDEGYTPPYGTFHELPTQIARFRNVESGPDSMRVAVAGSLAGTEMAGAAGVEPHLVFSDAPASFPLHLTSEVVDDRTWFLAELPAARFVLSHEALGERQFGRHRVILDPLRTEGVGVSDVLLYGPDGGEPPGTLEEAAELMLGEAAVRRGEAFGVYWETYGAAAGAALEIEIAIEEEGRGLFSRLRGLLPGGGPSPVRLSWSEPSPGEVFPRGVDVEPGDLDRGSYTLLVRVSWEGREPFVLRRGFEVR